MWPIDPAVRRRLARWVLVISMLTYVALAYSEQGTASVGLGGPPKGPLPFARERVFGLDLRVMSSLNALTWLRDAGANPAALVALPIDGDVVAALGQPEAQAAAFSALDLLVQAAGGAPLAVCLHKPAQAVGTLGVAQAAIGALSERYTNAIAYVSACEMGGDREWQRALAQAAMKSNEPVAGLEMAFVPLSAGAPADIHAIMPDELSVADVRELTGGGFVLLDLQLESVPDADTVQRSSDVLRNAAHVGLVLLRPPEGVAPAMVADVTRAATIDSPQLPQGFTSSIASGVMAGAGWQQARVGTLTYVQAQQEGATLAIEFVGSELYVLGLRSPEGGQLEAWLDREPVPTQAPDSLVNFVSDQARDATIDVFDGLTAARHRVTFVSTAGSVVAGFFVAGKTQPGWANGVASVGLIAIGVAALSDVCYTAIQDIRGRAPVPERRRRRTHPREFERTR